MNNIHVVPAEDYYQTLLRVVPEAKARIVIASMVLVWGERTAPIFIMLQDALARGVKVTVLLDNFTRLTYLNDLKPVATRTKRIKQTFASLKELASKGAHVFAVGKTTFPPHKGRCHVKITVVDDLSFSFGGVNFYDQGLKNHDYMLSSNSPETADCLEQLVRRIGAARQHLLDGEVVLDPKNAVLFDGGRRGSSLVYERAQQLASEAKRALFVSRMAPSGILARTLNTIDTIFYFNRPEQMQVPDSWAQAFDEQKYRIKNSYEGKRPIHAKCILFELKDGSKALISGSHNFSYRGVSYGTKEIALQSTDEMLWNELRAFIKTHIANQKSGEKTNNSA